MRKQWKQWQTLFSGPSKSLQMVTCSHESKIHSLLRRETVTNLDRLLKSKNITLRTKVCIVKAIVFAVVTYQCESWTVKKVEYWRIDAFDVHEFEQAPGVGDGQGSLAYCSPWDHNKLNMNKWLNRTELNERNLLKLWKMSWGTDHYHAAVTYSQEWYKLSGAPHNALKARLQLQEYLEAVEAEAINFISVDS